MTYNQALRNAAIRLLARREHSRRELILKLKLRGFQPQEVLPVLEQLAEEGLFSEARFINVIVRSRSRKGLGPLRIIAELQTHGIRQKEIEQDEDWQAMDWQQIARQVRAKKFGEQQIQDKQQAAKIVQHLMKRGFLPEHIDE